MFGMNLNNASIITLLCLPLCTNCEQYQGLNGLTSIKTACEGYDLEKQLAKEPTKAVVYKIQWPNGPWQKGLGYGLWETTLLYTSSGHILHWWSGQGLSSVLKVLPWSQYLICKSNVFWWLLMWKNTLLQ